MEAGMLPKNINKTLPKNPKSFYLYSSEILSILTIANTINLVIIFYHCYKLKLRTLEIINFNSLCVSFSNYFTTEHDFLVPG